MRLSSCISSGGMFGDAGAVREHMLDGHRRRNHHAGEHPWAGAMTDCGSGDANHDNEIIDEILTAVNFALSGCSGG